MSQFMLIDEDSNTYLLPEGVVIPDDVKIKADNKTVERSFRDGAVFPGLRRLKSKDITLDLPHWDTTDSGFRDTINEILSWCMKAVKLRDVTRNIETDILFQQASIKWDKGAYLRSSDNSLQFTQLIPYWEDVNYTIDYVSGTPVTTSGSLTITNNGHAEMPLLITFSNPSGLVPSIILQVTENNQGMTIEDPSFGLNVLDILIMDSKNCEITLNDVKRNQYIDVNTGFITIPLVEGTLVYTITGNVGFSVQYKARYFI